MCGEERVVGVPKSYGAIELNLDAFQKLYRLKYVEHVNSLPLLRDEVGCRDIEELKVLMNHLYSYLFDLLGGEVKGEKLEGVCPSCFKLGLTRFSRHSGEIRRCCRFCGAEVDDSFASAEDFDQSIEFGLTYQPECYSSWSKGLGNTFDYRKYGHMLLTSFGDDFADFKVAHPELAVELKENFVVIANGCVFHLMDDGMDVVRKVSVDVFFNHLNTLFHGMDKPLRKTKTDYSSKLPSEFQAPLAYVTALFERYRISLEEPKNQALINNLGIDIRIFRSMLKAQHWHISVKPFVETLFLINLLVHGRKELAAQVERDLDVDSELVEYYGDLKVFLKNHQRRVASGNGLIDALKSISVPKEA